MQTDVAALLVFLLLVAPVANAQVVDSLLVDPVVVDSLTTPPPDSLSVPTDSLTRNPRPPFSLAALVAFPADSAGWTLSDTLPARLPDREAAEALAQTAGTMLYDLGGAGWPDGWSPYGLDPRRVGLQLNGTSYTDPITGRPLLELLPMPWLDPPRIQSGRLGRTVSVGAQLRGFDGPRPVSEIRYGSSRDGLQSAFVVHAQRRRVRLFRDPGLLSLAMGYGGHGAEGEYPGSKLSAGRQLLTRVRLQQRFGAIEILNLHNRQRLGAHGGVVPFGAYETIFTRIGAQVADATAKRAIIRNDLQATLRVPLVPGMAPFEARGVWTAQTFRYALNSDTLSAVTRRLGYRLSQPLIQQPTFSLEARAEGWRERVAESTALPDSLGLTRTAFSAGGRLVYQITALSASAEAGVHATGTGAAFPGGAVDVAWEPRRFLRVFAEASVSGQPLSWIDTHGWGGWVLPLEADPEARTQLFRAGMRLRGGVFDLGITPFLHQTTDAFDLFVVGESDTLAVRSVGEAVRWAGVSVDAGFRRDAARGIYLIATPTLFQYAGEAGSSEARRVQESLPALFVRGRAGLRYLLFRGDLDMDLYVQARFWTPFQSRTLHPQTGLLAIPGATGTEVASSVAADVVLEAGVRDATIFVAFDNLLSGTAFLGNQLVPDYPLPEQRFRLGVYWPIFD